MKTIKIINLVLFLIAVILIINVAWPKITTITGNIAYTLDETKPKCYFSNSGELREIPLKNCCFEIQAQLACKQAPLTADEDINLKCFISETSERFYLTNQKTINYCKKEGYDVKVEK